MMRCPRSFRYEILAAVMAVTVLAGCMAQRSAVTPVAPANAESGQNFEPDVRVLRIAAPANLDFESGAADDAFPAHWGGGGHGYSFAVDSRIMHSGKGSLRIRWARTSEPGADDWATATQCVDISPWKGKRLSLSGYVKTEHVDSGAGIWLRIDSETRVTGFDNMQNRFITGTTDWQRYSDVLDVPDVAKAGCFGVFRRGSGTVWADDFKLDVVGSDVPSTNLKP